MHMKFVLTSATAILLASAGAHCSKAVAQSDHPATMTFYLKLSFDAVLPTKSGGEANGQCVSTMMSAPWPTQQQILAANREGLPAGPVLNEYEAKFRDACAKIAPVQKITSVDYSTPGEFGHDAKAAHDDDIRRGNGAVVEVNIQ